MSAVSLHPTNPCQDPSEEVGCKYILQIGMSCLYGGCGVYSFSFLLKTGLDQPTRGHIGRPNGISDLAGYLRQVGKSCLDNSGFCTLPANTAQLLTLHQHRAINQYMTANQIYLTLRISSSAETTLEHSSNQALTELNVA